GQLDRTDQRVLGELLAKLATECREQEERQDEQQRTEVDQQIAVGTDAELEQNGEDQRLLEDVVIECAEQLGNEERQEAPGAEQGELRILGHRPCTCERPGGPSDIGQHLYPAKPHPRCAFSSIPTAEERIRWASAPATSAAGRAPAARHLWSPADGG